MGRSHQTARNIKSLERKLGAFTREMYGGSFDYSTRGVNISGMTLDGRTAPAGTQAAIEFGNDGIKILGQKVYPTLPIPVFAVGYKGWKSAETLQNKILENNLDGILILDNGGLFIANQRYGEILREGPAALWAFICCLHESTRELSKISTNPFLYASQLLNEQDTEETP